MLSQIALLALLPLALACSNPDTNACASYISASGAALCSSFTKSTITATTGLPTPVASYCSSKPSQISKECSCYYTAGAVATTTAKTTAKTTATTLKTTTSAAATGTGSSTGTCGTPNYGLYGYGAGTTGGGSGSGTTVTSCSGLTSAAAAGGVIVISGIISGCGVVDLVGGTTVRGVGANSGLTGGGFRIKSQSNVILRNLKLHDPQEGDDLIQIQLSTKVWVDHCDLSCDGIVGDKDFYDGLLDITHAGDMITVSWTKFHDHWKSSLVGHSDSNAAEDTGKLHVTYHHNYWNNINSRTPSIRFGTAHIYSSCYENVPTSGINSRMSAQVLVEQNSFSSVAKAIITDLDSDDAGYAVQRNNIFTSSPIEITQVGSLTSVPYSYAMDAASCICAHVKAYAGTGIVG